MEYAALVDLFTDVASAVRSKLDELDDWGSADGHAGQYQHDVVADAVALPMLLGAGLGVVSEESGSHHLDRDVIAVIDPIDGSTNASMGLPWYATSIAAVDGDRLAASLVANQALGVTYTAILGQGAWRDGVAISPSTCADLSDAIVVVNDLPPPLGARQFRVYGAAALDLCAVADGTFDGFVDCGVGLAPWDYLGALLVCLEAGASAGTLDDSELITTDANARLAPVVAGTELVRNQLRAAATQ